MAPPQVATDSICSVSNQCVCSWLRRCSPRILIVTSRVDYSSIPAGVDGNGWSVLVVFISSLGDNSVFRLHRFRVAGSGRIIGKSNDVLEVLRDVVPPQICGATSTPSPDGRSLCLFSLQIGATDDKVQHRPLQLRLPPEDQMIPVSPLPGVPLGRLMRTRPISAAGQLWAPCFSEYDDPARLIMQWLHKDAGRWVVVATMTLPHWSVPAGGLVGHVLHGYAVVGDIILLSLDGCIYFSMSTREYEDHSIDARMLFPGIEAATGSSVAESFVMLPCCREFRNEAPFLTAVTLDGFGIQIRKALYVICQTASLSTVYKAYIVDGVLDCHDKTLTPHCTMDTHSSDDTSGIMESQERSLAWHFACTSKKIYAATRFGNELYMCNLRFGIPWKCGLYLSDSKTPSQLPISLILRVGKKVIIISDTFQGVYEVMRCADTSRTELMHIPTHGSVDLERKVIMSGSVVLSDHIFIVFYADEKCPYVLDLHSNQWSSVVTFPGFSSSFLGFPCRRSIFVDGFIYTCADGGLVAYELTRGDHSFYISKQIYMEISWQIYWERDRMCLDYVGKNEVSGAIMLCVVQGGDYNSGDCPPCSHPLCITTIQVKIEKTDSGELRSVMHHVDTSTSFVEHKGVIWTRNCVIAAS